MGQCFQCFQLVRMVLFARLVQSHLCVQLDHLFHCLQSYPLDQFHQLDRCGRLDLYPQLNLCHLLVQLHLCVLMDQLFRCHLLVLIAQLPHYYQLHL